MIGGMGIVVVVVGGARRPRRILFVNFSSNSQKWVCVQCAFHPTHGDWDLGTGRSSATARKGRSDGDDDSYEDEDEYEEDGRLSKTNIIIDNE